MPGRRIRWRLVKLPDGYAGQIVLPAKPGAVHPSTGQPVQSVTLAPKAASPSRSSALSSATSFARSALGNPLVQALIPPQVRAATAALDAITSNPIAQALARKFGARKAFSALMRNFA